jgi:hypothetical protein
LRIIRLQIADCRLQIEKKKFQSANTMIDKNEIVSRMERKRVAANFRLLPETVATFNEYVGLLQELAARAGRSESQMTVQGLLDHIAQKLAEDPDLKRWKARNEGRRRGKKADGPASPEAETTAEMTGAGADPFREKDGRRPPSRTRGNAARPERMRRGRSILWSKECSATASRRAEPRPFRAAGGAGRAGPQWWR